MNLNIAAVGKGGKNDPIASHQVSPAGLFIFFLIMILMVIASLGMDYYHASDAATLAVVIPVTLLAFYILFALKMASQWEKAVVLRLGKFHNLSGPGMFWIVPIMDSVTTWIDHRALTRHLAAHDRTVLLKRRHWDDGHLQRRRAWLLLFTCLAHGLSPAFRNESGTGMMFQVIIDEGYSRR